METVIRSETAANGLEVAPQTQTRLGSILMNVGIAVAGVIALTTLVRKFTEKSERRN